MTAQEKFYARLEELGLAEQYNKVRDMVGKVLDDGRVVVLIHYECDSGDPYTEIHYPSFEDLWKNPVFRKACKNEFYVNSDDDEFIRKLACWLDIHTHGFECPLFPVDLYWLPGFESKLIDYKDDPEPKTAEEIIKNLVAEHSLV